MVSNSPHVTGYATKTDGAALDEVVVGFKADLKIVIFLVSARFSIGRIDGSSYLWYLKCGGF